MSVEGVGWKGGGKEREGWDWKRRGGKGCCDGVGREGANKVARMGMEGMGTAGRVR